MNFPSRETVEQLRQEYPVGCRIVLDHMVDPYRKIPVGAQATVTGVDDSGSIMPVFDQGGSLHIVYGEDRCHKVETEIEALVTLNWYGRRQPDADATCPRCGAAMEGPTARHALSRRANIIICDVCGIRESLEDAGMAERLPLMDWVACASPQSGGGPWRG